MTPTVANVLSVFDRASEANLSDGLSWYDDAHSFARILSPNKPSKGAGVIAALSPMMGWDTNKNQAAKAFRNLTAEGLGIIGNCVKAERILYGADPLTVLSGNKVRAFYSTIMNPAGHSVPVVDRHAFDIAVGMVTDDKTRGTLSKKGVYALFADVYIQAAIARGVGAPQMQAVTWMQWREDKRAK